MKNFDMHFHSLRSDGNSTPEELIREAVKRKLQLITLLDHDRISKREFIQGAHDNGIFSLHSAEVSARDYVNSCSEHLPFYSTEYSQRLCNILDATIEGKKTMIVKQVNRLIEKGFDIELEKFYSFFVAKGKQVEGLNKFNIGQYLYQENDNVRKAEELFGRKVNFVDFFLECLKEGGRFYDEFGIKVSDYEPDIEEVGAIALDEGALLGVAHPNFTFKKGLTQFEDAFSDHYDKGVRAIEVNSKASPEYLKLIFKLKKKYKGIILTAGSDNHRLGYRDDKHEDFGVLNPYLSYEDGVMILKEFKDYFY